MCSAFLSGINAPKILVGGKSFNVGIPNGNFSVRELAEAAQRSVSGCKLIFTGEHGSDSRTYRVSFQRILNELKGYYEPEWDLDRGGLELVEFFKSVNFTEEDFRGEATNRLLKINKLTADDLINADLRWQ